MKRQTGQVFRLRRQMDKRAATIGSGLIFTHTAPSTNRRFFMLKNALRFCLATEKRLLAFVRGFAVVYGGRA
ncbi:MAG: hypothetical protein LBO77_07925 [Desulfovibrio sp.]|jgi:hypothetical protein|nr:hypothetical protein [Desulfovibrio sp.]